jgi:hypothetical protein
MIAFSRRNLAWCMVGLFLFFTGTLAVAGEPEEEMHYLFAGMLQERSKLKSWSCTITGMDPENLSFDMKLLSNGKSVRFSRTKHIPAHDGKTYQSVSGKAQKSGKTIHQPNKDEIVHACDNGQELVAWNVSDDRCSILKSTQSGRQGLWLWDPRTAGLVIDPEDTDYQKALNRRLEAWRVSAKVEHKGALRTVTFTKPYEWQDVRLILTIDTEHGFTPVFYRGDTLYKPHSKFPGKIEVYYEVTAKWEQVNGVWVPNHHRHIKGDGTVVREYTVSWDWINKDIDDKEFTIDALGVPNDAQKIYLDERGVEMSRDIFAPEYNRRGRAWIRWAVYALGFILIGYALLRHRLRKKASDSA